MTASLKLEHIASKPGIAKGHARLQPVNYFGDKGPLHLVEPEGQLHIHTAPYRGSFPLVLSEALRAAGLGSRVLVAQFLKGGVDQGESGSTVLCGRLELLRPEISCCISEKANQDPANSNKQEILQAVRGIWKVCKSRLLEGQLDQLVLDEVGLAIALGYLTEEDLISTLEKKPRAMDVMLTGPSIPKRIMSIADQITELRCGY